MKKINDICECGCRRRTHEEGLGYCLHCNPNCETSKCMSFKKC